MLIKTVLGWNKNIFKKFVMTCFIFVGCFSGDISSVWAARVIDEDVLFFKPKAQALQDRKNDDQILMQKIKILKDQNSSLRQEISKHQENPASNKRNNISQELLFKRHQPKEDRAKVEQQRQEFNRQLAQQRKKEQQWQQNIERLVDQINGLQQKVFSLRKNKDVVSSSASIDQVKQNLLSALSASRQRQEKLSSQLMTQNRKRALGQNSLSFKWQQLEDQLTRAHSRLEALNGEEVFLSQELSQLEEKRNRDLEEMDHSVKQLEERNNALSGFVQNLQSHLQAPLIDPGAFSKEQQSLMDNINELRQQNQKLQSQLSQLNQKAMQMGDSSSTVKWIK